MNFKIGTEYINTNTKKKYRCVRVTDRDNDTFVTFKSLAPVATSSGVTDGHAMGLYMCQLKNFKELLEVDNGCRTS